MAGALLLGLLDPPAAGITDLRPHGVTTVAVNYNWQWVVAATPREESVRGVEHMIE